MLKPLLLALPLAVSGTAFAQTMQPGEWEFTSTMSSPMFPQPRTLTNTHCVKPEDAKDPERWIGRQSQNNGCTTTSHKEGANTMSWQVSCPKNNMSGSGRATLTGTTMEGEMHVTGDMQGQKIEMTTKTHGRRLGPCKS